ncbi:MAG: hypothetical protein ACPL1Y_03925 [Thermoplasmata archaeon]
MLFFIAIFFGVLAPFIYYAQYSGIVQLGFIAFTALVAVFLVYFYGYHTESEDLAGERREENRQRFEKTAERALRGYTLSQNLLKESVLESLMAIYAVRNEQALVPYLGKEVVEFLTAKPENARIRKSGKEFYRKMEEIFRREGVI